MINLSTLLPRVSPFVVDCPPGIQIDALRRAASELCRASGCWVESFSVDSVQNQADYDLNAEHEYDHVFVKRIKRVWYDGTELPDNLGLWSVSNGVLSLSTAPAVAARAVKAELVLVGTRLCPEAANSVVDRYGDGIADLALFLIRSEEDRPYTDARGAANAFAKYEVILNQAKLDSVDGGQRSGNHINPLPDYF